MKIGILIPSLGPYGADKVASRLAEGFMKKGQEVVIILTDQPNIIDVNVPVKAILSGSDLTLFEKFLFAPVQYYRLGRLIKAEKIEVVISLMERANIFNLILWGNHLRVLTVHNFLRRSLKERHLLQRICAQLFYHLFINRANLLACVSRASMADFQNTFPIKPEKLTVIHNPFDVDKILSDSTEPLPPEYENVFDRQVIINVGHLTKQKGQWYLIRAFKKVQESLPDSRLVFVGDGVLRQYLENLAKDLGIADKVVFLGVQKNPFKFIARANLFGLSSLWEGFPNVLVEALICNSAVLAVDCQSGPRELLAPSTNVSHPFSEIEHSEYGVLTPPFDGAFKGAREPLSREELLMAEAMIELLKNDALREKYKKSSSRRIQSFRAENILSLWMNTIDMIKEKSPDAA